MKNALFLYNNDFKLNSVLKIESNLLKAYRQIPHLIIKKIEPNQLNKLPSSTSYDFVIIVDLSCITHTNFTLLFKNKAVNHNTTFIFHVMGDFFRKKEFHLQIEEKLMTRKVIYISPSTAYQKLIEKSLKKIQSPIIPFPLDLEAFHLFNEKQLLHFKTKTLKMKASDYLFVYAGRISVQKNILALLESFSIHRKKNQNAKLLIVGNYDSLETPTYFESISQPGNLFIEINSFIHHNDLEGSVVFLGAQKGKKLQKIIQCSDCFVSLSLYHDEDFGYFPIEAIYMGLGGIITNWGGYKDLNFNNNTLTKIKIYLKHGILTSQDFKLSHKNKLNKKITASNRKKISSQYSIQSVSKQIQKVLSNNDVDLFTGFSKRFKNFTTHHLFSNKARMEDYNYFYEGFWK